jgi:hypothetical protein
MVGLMLTTRLVLQTKDMLLDSPRSNRNKGATHISSGVTIRVHSAQVPLMKSRQKGMMSFARPGYRDA